MRVSVGILVIVEGARLIFIKASPLTRSVNSNICGYRALQTSQTCHMTREIFHLNPPLFHSIEKMLIHYRRLRRDSRKTMSCGSPSTEKYPKIRTSEARRSSMMFSEAMTAPGSQSRATRARLRRF